MRGLAVEASLLVGAFSLPVIGASEPSRPRGVGPEFAKFYKDADSFTCITQPSIKLSLSQLNDDYCDCPDGSDEPGTSACSYLSDLNIIPTQGDIAADVNRSNALPGFYCKNIGHRPAYAPFTAVNDGVCDYSICCDGSDEWAGVGGRKCENRCKEIGKEWRKQDEARQKSLSTALKKRKELVVESARLRKEVEDRIQTLQTELEAQDIKVQNLEKELADVERSEKGKVIKKPKTGGKLASLAVVAKGRTDELRENLERVRTERDEAIERVEELEKLLSTFKEEYNPNFNDEGVKRAVHAWENYAARDKPRLTNEAFEEDLDLIIQDDKANGLDWNEWTAEEESTDADVLYAFEEYLPAGIRVWVDQKLRDLRVMLVENGILATPRGDGKESDAVAAAKKRLKSAQDEVKKDRRELDSHKSDLEAAYGPDDVFRALKGQCISKEAGEYIYELCWMEKTAQKPKKSGGHTGMGQFQRIEWVTVDEEVSADGKGLGSGERMALKYENGQHCWNGPSRSTTVILACAEKDEIWKIAEEEKCVYRMEVGTPAVCEAVAPKKEQEHVKDEL